MFLSPCHYAVARGCEAQHGHGAVGWVQHVFVCSSSGSRDVFIPFHCNPCKKFEYTPTYGKDNFSEGLSALNWFDDSGCFSHALAHGKEICLTWLLRDELAKSSSRAAIRCCVSDHHRGGFAAFLLLSCVAASHGGAFLLCRCDTLSYRDGEESQPWQYCLWAFAEAT